LIVPCPAPALAPLPLLQIAARLTARTLFVSLNANAIKTRQRVVREMLFEQNLREPAKLTPPG